MFLKKKTRKEDDNNINVFEGSNPVGKKRNTLFTEWSHIYLVWIVVLSIVLMVFYLISSWIFA